MNSFCNKLSTINHKLFCEAKKYIPGGVNSPVRSFQAVGGNPVFVKRGLGSRIFDESDREFIDYCLAFGALILGHAHPQVIQQLKQAIEKGISFGTVTKLETELAKFIVEAIPSIEQVRLTNSGTEAVMSAIRLARAYTKKDKIIKFQGSYHGHADYLLDCVGIPQDFSKLTLSVLYNDTERLKEIIKKHKKDIAAIIVEPVAANMGVVLPKDDFLQGLRRLSKKHNIVLIFDEVITGFRVSFGGAQELFGIKPDLTCLGKIIGGGLPIGAFGGRKEIMKLLSPEGDVYQAGTFSGNPVSVSAGLTTLRILAQSKPYKKLEEMTKHLCEGIKQKAEEDGIKVRINFIGSMFSIFFTPPFLRNKKGRIIERAGFTDQEVRDYPECSNLFRITSGSRRDTSQNRFIRDNIARTQDRDLFKKFYQGLLKEGIYFSPSGFEANFISTAHTGRDIEKTLKAVDKSFKNLANS